MSASPSPVLRSIAPLAIASTAAMAAANWYFEPEKAAGWATALGFTAIMALAVWAFPRAFRRSDPQQRTQSTANAVDRIRRAVIIASLMMMTALSPNFAAGLGIGGAEAFEQIAKRGTMVITGIFLVLSGNAMPKLLIPLSSAQCGDPVKAQAFQRFVGWVWVLTGLAFTVAWLALPLDLASPVAFTCLIAGMVITVPSTVRLWRTARPRTN